MGRVTIRFTTAQQALLVQLARGCTQSAAAAAVGLSAANARYHLGRLLRATQTANVTALVALAVASGVLAGDPWPLEATSQREITVDLLVADSDEVSDGRGPAAPA